MESENVIAENIRDKINEQLSKRRIVVYGNSLWGALGIDEVEA
jgi:hypothetical protein